MKKKKSDTAYKQNQQHQRKRPHAITPQFKDINRPLSAPSGFISIGIKESIVPQFQKGYPLLHQSDIQTGQLPKSEQGQLLWLTTSKGQYIGTGYYGIQNKGIGWIISRNKEERFKTGFFIDLFKDARHHRNNFPSKETTAFRWFNGEGDGFGGLTIDCYDSHYVFTWYSYGAYAYAEIILKAFEIINPSFKSIYYKRRFDAGGKYIEGDDFVKGIEAPEPLVIYENALAYEVYLNDGPMVGIFLDQRDVRFAIRQRYSQGLKVLNTFSYTGAFSVAACAGGAAATVSVDLASRSLQKTSGQFYVNNFPLESNQIVVEDVFDYFKYALRNELSFDTVILDPPSYARSKKYTFSAEKDYTTLLEDAIAITKPGGTIIASTNCSSFDMKAFIAMAISAFANANYRFQILESYKLPSDYRISSAFQEGNYLKVLFLQKKAIKR